LLFIFLAFNISAIAQNSTCATAAPLTIGGTMCSGTSGGANSGDPTGNDDTDGNVCSGSYSGGDDFIFEYTATTSDALKLDLFASNTWTGVLVTEGCPTTGTCFASSTSSSRDESLTTPAMTIGLTYYIHISTYPSPQSAGQFCLYATLEAPPSPPSNDDCANAQVLTVNADLACGVTTSGTINLASASGEDESTCGGTEDDDVWYSFVATATSHTINLNNVANGTTDLYHSLWEGTCGALTNILCSDPNNSTATGLTIGNNYLLRVYSWTSTAGQTTTFDVCIGTQPIPDNDECANAEVLTVNADLSCGVVTAGTTASATASAQANDVTGTPNTDVWYSFVATGTQHRILLTDVVNQGGGTSTSTDMGMGVYDGTGGCAGLVFFDDSDPNTLDLTGLTASTTYYVRVYGWSSTIQYNNFNICVGTPPPPPSNDECSGAIALSNDGTVVNGTTVAATGAGGAMTCDGSIGNNVWYTLTGDGGDITVNVVAANEGAQVGIYESSDGSCSGFTEGTCIASVDDFGVLDTEVTFTSTIGTVYYVNLGAWISSGNDFPFTVSATSTALSNDDFGNLAAFTYYPNPVNNILTLDAQKNIESVVAYNMLGQEVLRLSPNVANTEVDMSSLLSGAYFVKVSIQGATKTVRIIKQ